MPQRLLSLISNTQNNTHRNISWHIDPKDRPGTALPSRISWKLQPACPEGLGGDRGSLGWSHTLGRTRVKAGLRLDTLSSHSRADTKGSNQHRAEWECEKEAKKPLPKGFAPGAPGQGTAQAPHSCPRLLPQQHQCWPCSSRG